MGYAGCARTCGLWWCVCFGWLGGPPGYAPRACAAALRAFAPPPAPRARAPGGRVCGGTRRLLCICARSARTRLVVSLMDPFLFVRLHARPSRLVVAAPGSAVAVATHAATATAASSAWARRMGARRVGIAWPPVLRG